MLPMGSCMGTPGSQLVKVFQKVMEALRDGTLLEEVRQWGAGFEV